MNELSGNKYINQLVVAFQIFKINYKLEYKFSKKRKFRFDIAIPESKIAVEFEGGIYAQGRHIRGKGYALDCNKYNLAVKEGWKVLRYTTQDAKVNNWEFGVVEDVKELMR